MKEFLVGLILILLALGIYFVPSFVGRDKRNFWAILALNLCLGWTVLGWVGALVWALTVDSPIVDH